MEWDAMDAHRKAEPERSHFGNGHGRRQECRK